MLSSIRAASFSGFFCFFAINFSIAVTMVAALLPLS